MDKLVKLKDYIKNLNSVAVAFSAGVDSTFLLKTAHEVLNDNVIALSANSPLFPKRELILARDFCKKNNIRHIIVDFDIEDIKHNPLNRCYICKKRIFSKFLKLAQENKIQYVLEGTNFDDINDFRPGLQAIRELGIKSPLLEIGFTKDEIRLISNNQKSSFACLASRFEYGQEITKEMLEAVEKAEDILYNAHFKQFRVRVHSKIARIEVLSEDFNKLIELNLYSRFKKLGFDYVTMDLKGYRTGSMNEAKKLE